ncbi:hypothetical protein F511_41756 [Dorcoceras hygrometricum]|uniref:Uncharacterized protein n=1 Tax=Dorcoceras hygrometricum TaxID=472368 RepID=A0A2Z7CNG8_9LAMI|nr:hypothetical protein F511_41756 [Dorcoceras hygrometricum]
MFEVALDSSRKALSFITDFGGRRWLEKKHEAAIFGSVFVRAGSNQFSRGLNCGNCCTESGYPAGRGADPARGAPGGGSAAGRGFYPAGGAPGGG